MALGAVLFLVIALYLAPATPRFLRDGLDASWAAALFTLAREEVQFGRDVVFTYGPLGFLTSRWYWPGFYAWTLGWHFFLALALAVGFLPLTARQRPAARVLLALLLCLVVAIRPRNDVPILLSAVLLVFSRARTEPTPSPLRDGMLVTVLSAAAFMKFLHLFAGAAAVAAVALLEEGGLRRRLRIPALYALLVGIAWLASGQELGGLPAFVHHGLYVASGYAETMAVAGSHGETAAILACFGLVLGGLWIHTTGAGARRRWTLTLTATWLFFLAFKLGFVRQTHRTDITWCVLAGLALVTLCDVLAQGGGRQVTLRHSVIAGLCLAGLVVTSTSNWHGLVGKPTRQAQAFYRLLRRPESLTERHQRAVRRIQADYPLPRLEGTVDFFGNQQVVALVHGVDYRPRPIFQSISVFSHHLAELNRARYAGPAAPDHVLVRVAETLGYPASLHDGEAMLELLRRYDLAGRHGKILLFSRGGGLDLELEAGEERRFPLGAEIPIEAGNDDIVWAEVRVPKRLAGRLAQTLFRLPSLTLEVQLQNGDTRTHRFASLDGARFLLSPFLRTNRDLADLVEREPGGRPPRRVVESIRVDQEGDFGETFRRGVEVRLFTATVGGRDAR